MKIIRVSATPLNIPVTIDVLGLNQQTSLSLCLTEIETDTGLVGHGMTAITEYDRTNPDIVLMDITMPQMEGIEAAEKIVAQHPEARIVMVSSVGYQENIVAALQRGARHFVQKPVKPEVLYEVIKYVLGEDGAVANAAGAGA